MLTKRKRLAMTTYTGTYTHSHGTLYLTLALSVPALVFFFFFDAILAIECETYVGVLASTRKGLRKVDSQTFETHHSYISSPGV